VWRGRAGRAAEIFGVLRDRELRALWLSDWISDAGNFVTSIALAVYVNDLTGTAAAVGLAIALRSVPWFTFGPFAGLLADRVDRRRLMIGTTLARALLVGALPFTRTAWQAYVLSLASFMLAPLFRPARSALLAQVAARDKLVPALAVMETTHHVLHTVGPALGGLVVLAAGARNAFFVDAASFVIAAAVVSTIAPRPRPEPARRSAFRELRVGVQAVFGTPVVRTYTLLTSAVYLGFAGIVALLVVYVRDVLERPGGQYGLVLSVAGLGTVLASLLVAARDANRPRTPWAFMAAAGLATFAFAAGTPGFFLLFPLAFAAGVGEGGVDIPMSATLAEALPDDVRGRAYGITQAVNELGAAAGSLTFAWLGETHRLGPATGMAAAGAVGAGLGLLVLVAGGAEAIRRRERVRLAARTAEP
jgi:NRE family putative nickel resistance protein-like MFS transporter